jgi:hypothetical protein
METVIGILLGVSLSAACGFRIFAPLLVMSIASRAGHIALAPGFEWIGSAPAIVMFAVATGLEVTAYYVLWLDNILDMIATPAAVIAGIIVMASCVSGMSPLLKWTLAVVAGGGAAGIVQGATALTRAASTATTGGLGNPAVSTIEAGGAFVLSVLAIAVPALVGIVVLALLVLAVKKMSAKLRPPRSTPGPTA